MALGSSPNTHKPGKRLLILDLSVPEGFSINDFIDKELCSVSYISIDNVAEAVLHLGRGALLAKADVKEAFCIIPVAPEDRFFLAMPDLCPIAATIAYLAIRRGSEGPLFHFRSGHPLKCECFVTKVR